MKFSRFQRIIFTFVFAIFVLGGFGVACDKILATPSYNNFGILASENFIPLSGALIINSVTYTASSIPAETSIKIQFSNDNSNWYNSSGTLNGFDILSSGTNSLNFSGLGWKTTRFYYRAYFYSDGSATPVLNSISVAFFSNDGNYYTYSSSGTLTSANILPEKAYNLSSFGYNVSSLPPNTGITIQFSSDNSSWYSSAGVLNSSDTLSAGVNTISLASLNWNGPNFYYKAQFTGDGTTTPVLKSVNITFDTDTTAPTTVADANGYTFGTESATNVTTTLTCFDGSGVGCAATMYCNTSADCTPDQVYTSPIPTETNGTTYLRYYSIDSVGNAETPIISQTIILNKSQGWLTPWLYRKQITIDHTKVGSGTEDETNFPVLISLSNLTNVNTNGTDIRFTQSNGTTLLSREIESYAPQSGTLTAWVKIPTLSHTIDTVIYMYYGNASATEPSASSTYGSQAVWTNHYAGVWHLNDADNSTIKDSTANANDGTNHGVTSATGPFGAGAGGFDGTSNNVSRSALNDSPTAILTISAWANTNNVDQGKFIAGFGYDAGGPVGGYPLLFQGNNFGDHFRFELGSGVGGVTSGTIPTAGQWYYITGTSDGTTTKLYVNGVQEGGNSLQGAGSALSPYSLAIGKIIGGGFYYSGTIADVRVSSIARTAGWISTEYANQNSPSSFVTASAEEAYDTTAPVTTASANSNYTFGDLTGSDQTITLSCTDNMTGCDTTKYCVDQINTCTPTTAYQDSFIVSPTTNNAETYYVRYFSIDKVTNTEQTNSKTINFNKNAFAAGGGSGYGTVVQTVVQTVTNTVQQVVNKITGNTQTTIQTNYPSIVESVPQATPEAFQNTQNILELKRLQKIEVLNLPEEIKNLAIQFPSFSSTLEKVGINTSKDVEKLKTTQLVFPGLSETVGLATNLPVSQFSSEQLAKVPSNIVFAQAGMNNIDLSMHVSLASDNSAVESVRTIQNKPIYLSIKPNKAVSSVKGYIVLKSTNTQPVANVTDKNSAVASLLNTDIIQKVTPTKATTNTPKELVVASFDYTDTNNTGIYSATVSAPTVDGQYEIKTVLNYVASAPENIVTVLVVDPEGYVYETAGQGKETRIGQAVVTIYWLNPATKKFEVWPAKDYQQINPQVTDITGKYSYLVPVGSYYLQVKADGFDTYVGKVFQITEGSGVHENIKLVAQSSLIGFFSSDKVLLWIVVILLITIVTMLILNFIKKNKLK